MNTAGPRRSMRARGALGPGRLSRPVGSLFGVGDEVLFGRNDRRLGVLNGTRGSVSEASLFGLVVETDRGQKVPDEPPPRTARLAHGYACTVHKSQGETVDRAFVLGGDALYREAGYVAMSRPAGVDRAVRGHLSLRRRDRPTGGPAPRARVAGAREGALHLAGQAARVEHVRGGLPPSTAGGAARRPRLETAAERTAGERIGERLSEGGGRRVSRRAGESPRRAPRAGGQAVRMGTRAAGSSSPSAAASAWPTAPPRSGSSGRASRCGPDRRSSASDCWASPSISPSGPSAPSSRSVTGATAASVAEHDVTRP